MKVVATVGDGSEVKKEITLTLTQTILGRGSCGRVMDGRVEETGENVAVKIVAVTRFRNEEVKYLKTLKHCNIVKLLYHFKKISTTNSHLQMSQHVLMESMPETLSHIYKLKPNTLTQFEVKLYTYQLLRGVAYIHNKGICHRDIKPGNILLDPASGALKICDFGFVCELSSKTENSPKAGTPQYQAPELLLGYTNYTNSVDIWSVGCILVELLRGQERLFSRAKNETQQIIKVAQVFGTPTEEQFLGMKPPYPFYALPDREAKPWSEIIPPSSTSDDVVSLCRCLLCYSPSFRLRPHRALTYKFFDDLRKPENRLLTNGNPLPPLFNFQPGEFPGGFDHLIPSYLNEMNESVEN